MRKRGRVQKLKGPGNFAKGKYTPVNPKKYIGNVNSIIFRSSWELKVFEFCDMNDSIKKWASEEIAIAYPKPTPKGIVQAKYYPDLFIERVNSDGVVIRELVEIKPYKQTQPSRARKRSNKIVEDAQYTINSLKWEAATRWCAQRDIRFRLLTERDIYKT
jgi:hypothetical protein